MSLSVPWAMEDQQGNLTGFEIDVATKVAQDMGVDVEFGTTVWDELIPDLVGNKFDVIISGMSITPQRNLTVNFTRPYAHSTMQMTANIPLASELKSHDEFNIPSVMETLENLKVGPHRILTPLSQQGFSEGRDCGRGGFPAFPYNFMSPGNNRLYHCRRDVPKSDNSAF